MRITILHQEVAAEAAADEQDVQIQREAVAAALGRLGHEVQCVACNLALDDVRDRLLAQRPQLVFNLVESLGGADRLISLVPMLLDTLGFLYTGAPSEALIWSSNKVIAKRQLVAAGLPTAPWMETAMRNGASVQGDAASGSWPSRWIRKPIWDHASLGMTDDAVGQYHSPEEVLAATRHWQQRLARPCFAERFIEGREFNLSLLERAEGVEVLPLAEIDFGGYPAGRPHIVGFAAKWHDDSAEAIHTPRRFAFKPSDAVLLQRLRELALACWDAFGLAGYCRVDFRVDGLGQPWILEINANPCLSPGSGFPAAVEQAGHSYEDTIHRIVQAALRRATNLPLPEPPATQS